MDRRKLSLTLSEDDLRRNSQQNSRRSTPTPSINLISEEELKRRIRELISEEKPADRRDPPRPVAAVTPMIARREPSPARSKSVVKTPISRLDNPIVKQSSTPYRRVNNRQYFNWDDDEETAPTEQKPSSPITHYHTQARWDDATPHSKDNCELCSLAKKAFDREQERKLKKKSSNISRHCEALREFQEDYHDE